MSLRSRCSFSQTIKSLYFPYVWHLYSQSITDADKRMLGSSETKWIIDMLDFIFVALGCGILLLLGLYAQALSRV
jgi:hypothetical protein